MENSIEILDLRKIPFPQSIITTKRHLDAMGHGTAAIITDSNISKDKITEFVIKYGWHAAYEKEADLYKVYASK